MVMQLSQPIAVEEKSLPTTPLTPEELALLERQVLSQDGEIAWGNGYLQDLFRSHRELIIDTCRAAKFAFGNVSYRGLSADDGAFGVSPILPEHVTRTTGATQTPGLDWTRTFTADSDYFQGFGTDNTTALTIDKRLMVLVLGVKWTQGWAPTTEKIRFQVGGRTYPYQSIRHGWDADNVHRIRAARLRPMIWGPKDTVLSNIYSLLAGEQHLVIVGLAFAKGDLLRTEAPTTVEV